MKKNIGIDKVPTTLEDKKPITVENKIPGTLENRMTGALENRMPPGALEDGLLDEIGDGGTFLMNKNQDNIVQRLDAHFGKHQ